VAPSAQPLAASEQPYDCVFAGGPMLRAQFAKLVAVEVTQ
jgi:hypothetical protein